MRNHRTPRLDFQTTASSARGYPEIVCVSLFPCRVTATGGEENERTSRLSEYDSGRESKSISIS
ncbi:hypothetical protein ABTE45_19230, partial [Acinetobacter baumannii]